MEIAGQKGTKGRFAENIMYFARALRAAGLPVGPGTMLDAVRAVEAAGIRRRDDFYWALHSVCVNRREQKELFDQAFQIFWRNPELLEKMLSLLLPVVHPDVQQEKIADDKKTMRRVAEALAGTQRNEPMLKEEKEVEIDATLTFSDEERLQSKDFEEMSAEELDEARKAIKRMTLPLSEIRTRRFEPKVHGRRIDMRRSFRATLKGGGDVVEDLGRLGQDLIAVGGEEDLVVDGEVVPLDVHVAGIFSSGGLGRRLSGLSGNGLGLGLFGGNFGLGTACRETERNQSSKDDLFQVLSHAP